MNRNHHQFDPEAFLLPFDGREEILHAYLASLPQRHLSVVRPIPSARALIEHLNACAPEEHRSSVAGMQESFELCSDEGHERLLQVCRMKGISSPTLLSLPVECLALHILTDNREVFEAAVSFDAVMSSESLELFKPVRAVNLVARVQSAVNHFRAEIASSCGDKYGSRRVLLKHFDTADFLTLGFYFEKQPKAQRSLAGSEASPNLERLELRPIQLDFVVFEKATGVLSIKSGWGRLTEQIRQAFARSFLSDAAVYEAASCCEILELHPLLDFANDLSTSTGELGIITEVEYTFPHDTLATRYHLNSMNVRETLQRDRLAERIQQATLRKSVVQMPVQGSGRRRRVTLQIPNKVQFKRGAGAEAIVRQLRDWQVFNAPIASQVAA